MARVWSPLLGLGLAAPLALGPTSAAAEIGVAEFSPEHLQQLIGLDDFTYDSDWFPMDSPVQLRLIVHAGNSVAIDMPGDGLYDWEAAAIHFEGEPDGGRFGVDVGFTLDSKVRFDVAGIQWESDIIGPYDYAVISETAFTPYLLDGNPDRPAMIMDETDPVTLVSVPITPDILVAAGNLDIDVYVIIDGAVACDAIEVATIEPKAQWDAVTIEGESKHLDAGVGPLPDPFVVDGVLFCNLETAPTIVLKPTLVMTILGTDYEIAGIDIPVMIPPFDDTIQFNTETMEFPRPEPPPEPETTGTDSGTSDGATGSGGATDSGAGTTGASATDTDSSSATEGASGGFGGPDEEGCACSTGGGPGPLDLGFGLGLVVVAAGRRRRS
jgi:MYXO-CTERM domain-containing protein